MLILLSLIALIIILYFRVKLDYTKDKKLILWYDNEFKERKYIILW